MSERPRYSILDLATAEEETIGQAANLLVEGFRDNWHEAWPTVEEALEEVREALGDGRICRAALSEDGPRLDRRHTCLRRQRLGAAPAGGTP